MNGNISAVGSCGRWLARRPLLATCLLVGLLAGCQAPAATRPEAAGATSAAAAAPAGSSAPVAAPALLTVSVAHAGVTPNVAPVWVAADLDFGRQYGLDIQVRQTRTAVLSQAALLAGEIDYAWTGIGTALAARASGSDVVMIAATQTRAAADLIVQPEITSAEGLRGKKLGVQSLGGGPPHLRTLKALERLGLEPARDNVTILQTGDEPTAMAAVLDRAIDGATLSYSAGRELRDRGYPGWDLATQNVTELLGIATREVTSRERGEETRRLLRTLGASMAYLKQIDSNREAREQVGRVVSERLQVAPDLVLLQLDAIQPYLPTDLQVTMTAAREQQQDMLAVQPTVASVNIEEMVNLTRLNEITSEGFFTNLRVP